MTRVRALFALFAWLTAGVAQADGPPPLTLESLALPGAVAEWLSASPRRPLTGWPCVRSVRIESDRDRREAIAGVLRQVEVVSSVPIQGRPDSSVGRRIEGWIELRDAAVGTECYSNWVAAEQLQRTTALDWVEALSAAHLAPAGGVLPGRTLLERLNRVNLTSDRIERLLASEPGLAPATPPPSSEAKATDPDRPEEPERRAILAVLESRLGDLRKLLPLADPETFGALWLLDHADPMALIRRIIMTDQFRGALLPPLVLAAERTSGSEEERLEAGAAESTELGAAFYTPFYRPKQARNPTDARELIDEFRRGDKADLLFFDTSADARNRRALKAVTILWTRIGGAHIAGSPLVLAIEVENRRSLSLILANPGARLDGLSAVEVVVTPETGKPRRALVAEIGRDARGSEIVLLPGQKTSRLELAVGWREDVMGGPLFDEAGTYRVKAMYRPVVLGTGSSRRLDETEIRESESWNIRVENAPPGDQACGNALEAIGWLKAGVSVERPDREGPAHPDWPTVCAGTSFAPRLLLFDLERAIQSLELYEPAAVSPRDRSELDRLASDPTFALRGKAEELRLRLARLAELRENSQ